MLGLILMMATALSGCGAFKTEDFMGTTTACPVHQQPLREDIVRIVYGTMMFSDGPARNG